MDHKKIVIGTRGSKLALWQAGHIQSELQRRYPGTTIEINTIKTTGDKILDVPLAQVGGKGLFVKEIEEALLQQEADIAVHSMKDVPTEFPEGLHLAVICAREDPRDALISRVRNAKFLIPAFHELPQGAKIGTSSLRRSCQLLNVRPDLKIEQLRGNLDTRLKKLDEGQYDAIILAAAGVKRLGLHNRITETLPFAVSLPAIGQGAIGIECRRDDAFINTLIAPLNHDETSVCVRAERAFLKKLEGGCQVPIAAHARLADGRIMMDGLVGSIAGDRLIKGYGEGDAEHPESLGIRLAEDVLERGAKEILDEVYKRYAPPVNGEISS
jgi:hydroxymethylbilane synthase